MEYATYATMVMIVASLMLAVLAIVTWRRARRDLDRQIDELNKAAANLRDNVYSQASNQESK